jgi:hypothetical protein
MPEDKGAVGVVKNLFRSIGRFLFGSDNVENGENAKLSYEQARQTREIIDQLAEKHSADNQYFLPVLDIDINLEDLNKGAYGNSSFYVDPEKNPQWHCIYSDLLRNQIKYFVDVHSMYSLMSTTNFEMVVNFTKKMNYADELLKMFTGVFSWFGGLFSGMFSGILNVVILIIVFILLLVCFSSVKELVRGFFHMIVKILLIPINLIISLIDKKGA